MFENEMKPLARKTDIVVQELENEVLVFDLSVNKAFCLNETCRAVWAKCDGTRSIAQISKELGKEIDSSINLDFVRLAIEQLKQDNLLENNTETSKLFRGVSRRELIRNVGLASLVALPVVSSLVAPPAISAQSGCPDPDNNMNAAPNGCSCIGANDCVTNCCGTVSGPRICVAVGGDPIGSQCRANCECANSCVTGTCT